MILTIHFTLTLTIIYLFFVYYFTSNSIAYRTANQENWYVQQTQTQSQPQSQVKQAKENTKDQSSKKTESTRGRDPTLRNHSIEMQNPLMIMPVFIN